MKRDTLPLPPPEKNGDFDKTVLEELSDST